MRPSARTRANRRNARASTGPKTAAGKARVAKNALRHGLSVAAAVQPGLIDEIELMAGAIAGQGASPLRLERARRIAEAQIDLLRARRARYALLADHEARRAAPDPRHVVRACKRLLRGGADEADLAMVRTWTERQGRRAPPSLAEGFAALALQLARLDRYERRALSRRKTAIRDFDRALAT